MISTNISSIENEENIKQKATYIHEVANLILQPFLTNNNIVSDLQSITCCLDLIPVAISALFNFRKQYTFLQKLDIQVINSFFESEVPVSASILNILTEIYPRLRNRHLVHIKKQIIALVPNLQRQCDEFPGIMRICLRFFEQSNDAQWIHIFRILYANVPLGEMQNVEALLEQILSQSGHLDQAVIDILEDTATHFCKCVTTKAANQQTLDIEIPLIGLADVRLLLMTMRITNTSNLHLNLMLPSIVSGNAEESSTGVRNSRALIMLLISISFICIYQPQVFKELYKDSIFKTNEVCNIDTITKHMCRTVHCCLVDDSGRISNWLSSVRGMEIISACMYSVFYPSVTQACTNFISQCILSRYENDAIESLNRISENEVVASPYASPDEVIKDINISELLSECLITVFQDINDCRSALLSLTMKGLVACFQSSKMLKVKFLVAEETFIKLFRDICYRYPRILVQSHSSLENYILTASVLPVSTLERILFPLGTVCSLSNAIYGYLITCYRKCLLHPDIERKSFAIKSLLTLLPQVQAPCQIDIIQTLLHSFSLPLPCRILFYTELTRLIWDQDLSFNDSNGNNERTSVARISKTVLTSIQQKVSYYYHNRNNPYHHHHQVLTRLSQYFVYEQENVDNNEWMGLVFCPDKCTIKFQKVKGFGRTTEGMLITTNISNNNTNNNTNTNTRCWRTTTTFIYTGIENK